MRVVELLRSAGIRSSSSEPPHRNSICAWCRHRCARIDASPRNPESLWAAGLAGALCVIRKIVEDDDLRCLEAALLAQELASADARHRPAVESAVGRLSAVESAIPRGLDL